MNFIRKNVILSSALLSISCLTIHAMDHKEDEGMRENPFLSGQAESPLNNEAAPSLSKHDLEKTILSLMPLVRGQANFTKCFATLVTSKDIDSVRYMGLLERLVGSKITDDMLKMDAHITERFTDFLLQSLEGLLKFHAQVTNKEGDDYVGVAKECLGKLWGEINEASNRTAADIMKFLGFGWQVEDSEWSVMPGKTPKIKYSGLVTKDIQEKRDLLLLFGEDKRAFNQLTSEAGQENFYRLCGDNIFASQGFEELMFYQKINVALMNIYPEPPSVNSMLIEVLHMMKHPGIEQAPEIYNNPIKSSGKRSGLLPDGCFVIDKIRDQRKRRAKITPSNAYFIETFLGPLAEFVQKEIRQLKEEEKKKKGRLKKQRQKANKTAARALQENAVAKAPVGFPSSAAQAAEGSEENQEDGKEPEALDLAAVPAIQKEDKSVKASKIAANTWQFKWCTFSDVILGHQKGTVNTADFAVFLNSVGGSLEKPTHKGMTYYTLPNLGTDADRYPTIHYHVHLPHGKKEPFYPAILHHFIRPSLIGAGFTPQMFG